MPTAGRCVNCTRNIPARRGRTPRFCPVCGHRLVPAPNVAGAGGLSNPQQTGNSVRAMGAFVFGICSICVPMCFPLGIIAIAAGRSAEQQIERNQTPRRHLGFARAGWILGVISLALWGLVCVGAIL